MFTALIILSLPLDAKGQNDSSFISGQHIEMNEITVRASKILMVYSDDTLVYNADYLCLSAGAMLNDLINALPETRINSDGLITVKGEPVSELLIEGRDFFHGDPTLALKNLPAYTVKKVKVYRKVPKDAYLSRHDKGRKALKTDPLVMDVRLSPKYRNGVIANVEMASGLSTQENSRYLYLDRLFGLHYNDQRSLSGYIGLNNVNETGRPHSKGLWKGERDEMGEQSQYLAGMDYTNLNTKNKMTTSGMFRIEDTRKDMQIETSEMRFLTNGRQHSMSFINGNERKISADVSGKCFYPAKYFTIEVQPRVTFSKMKSISNHYGATFSEQQEGALQDILSKTLQLSENDYMALKNAVNRQHRIWENNVSGIDLGLIARSTIRPSSFKRPLLVSFTGNFWSNSKTEGRENNIAYTAYNKESISNRQYFNSPINHIILNLKFNYTAWAYNKNGKFGRLMLSFQSDFRGENRKSLIYDNDKNEQVTKNGYNSQGDSFDDKYDKSVLDTVNSYRKRTAEHNQILTINGMYNISNKVGFSVSLPITFKSRSFQDNRVASSILISRNNWQINPTISFQFRNLSFGYSFSNILPGLDNLACHTDYSDPMLVIVCNESLRSSNIHTPSISFTERHAKDKGSVSLMADFQLVEDAIKRMYYYDVTTGITTIQTKNINGDWRVHFTGKYQQTFGKQNQWLLSSFAQMTFEKENQYSELASINETSVYAARKILMSEEAELTYNHRNWLFSLHGVYKWAYTRSIQGHFDNINYINFRYGGAVRTPVFYGVSLTTNFFVHTDKGMIYDEQNRSYLILNANVQYDLNSKWSFQLEGVDMLRQLTSVSLGGNSIGWSEVRRNTRPSFFMLHVFYRFNLLPKEKN